MTGDPTASLPVPHTMAACAGAVAGAVMRRIAYRAGAYAPGIQEFLWFGLATPSCGRTLEAVDGWLRGASGELHAMGYRLHGRRVLGERTGAVLEWVRDGKGYRGAVLTTDYRTLRPAERADSFDHAVGLVVEPAGGKVALVMLDPWPGAGADRGPVPPNLELAHRQARYGVFAFHWSGWS
jgi:hypothetical protein